MLSNLAVHIANGVFLAFSADDEDHAYLFSLRVPAAPISLLPLQHRFRFISTVDGVAIIPPQEQQRSNDATTGTGKVATAAAKQVVSYSSKPKSDDRAAIAGDVVIASRNGRYVAVLAPFECRHALIDVQSGRIRRFLTGRPLVAASWAAVDSSRESELALLNDIGDVVLINAEAPVSDPLNMVVTQRLELRTLLAHHCPRVIFGNAPVATVRDRTSVPAPVEGHPPVAVTFCGPTRGLPMLLFVLSARGDVFCVAIPEDDNNNNDADTEEQEMQPRPSPSALQERGSSATRLLVDGIGATLSRQAKVLAAVEGGPLSRAITAHGATTLFLPAVVASPSTVGRHLIAPSAVGNAGAALVLHTFCVDLHAGIHAVVVLHALGVAHLYLLREEEIIAGNEPRVAEPSFRVKFTEGPFPCPVLYREEPSSSSSTSQGTSVYDTVQSRMQSVALLSDGNICVIKAGFAPHAPQAFLVAFPVWCEAERHWCYLNDSECRSQCSARLPVAGWDPQCMPDPVATRVPVDLTQYSVALGDCGNTLLLFPAQTHAGLPLTDPPLHHDGCLPSRPVMTLSTADLLEQALRAQATSYALLHSSATEGSGSKPSSTAKLENCSNSSSLLSVLNGVATLCDGTVRAMPGTTATSREAMLSEFAKTLTACQRQVANASRQGAQREAALLAKVEELQRRVAAADKKVQSLRDAGLAARWAPQGADAFSHVNATLGKIHTALNEFEAVVEDRELDLSERKAQASKEAID